MALPSPSLPFPFPPHLPPPPPPPPPPPHPPSPPLPCAFDPTLGVYVYGYPQPTPSPYHPPFPPCPPTAIPELPTPLPGPPCPLPLCSPASHLCFPHSSSPPSSFPVPIQHPISCHLPSRPGGAPRPSPAGFTSLLMDQVAQGAVRRRLEEFSAILASPVAPPDTLRNVVSSVLERSVADLLVLLCGGVPSGGAPPPPPAGPHPARLSSPSTSPSSPLSAARWWDRALVGKPDRPLSLLALRQAIAAV